MPADSDMQATLTVTQHRLHSPAGILADEVAEVLQRHGADTAEGRVVIQAYAALVSTENRAATLRDQVDELERRLRSPHGIDNPGAGEAVSDLMAQLADAVERSTGRPVDVSAGAFSHGSPLVLLRDLQDELDRAHADELLLACSYFDGGERFDPERLSGLLLQAVALTRQLREEARRSGRAFADLIAGLAPAGVKKGAGK